MADDTRASPPWDVHHDDRLRRRHPHALFLYLSTGAWTWHPRCAGSSPHAYPSGALLLTDGATTGGRSGSQHKVQNLQRLARGSRTKVDPDRGRRPARSADLLGVSPSATRSPLRPSWTATVATEAAWLSVRCARHHRTGSRCPRGCPDRGQRRRLHLRPAPDAELLDHGADHAPWAEVPGRAGPPAPSPALLPHPPQPCPELS
ncbi:hypothetical protein QJS66_01965 [Kocuria rhizophila]|nr:hypothetical protein QJS66_01965 [Kocuria rhizophila]